MGRFRWLRRDPWSKQEIEDALAHVRHDLVSRQAEDPTPLVSLLLRTDTPESYMVLALLQASGERTPEWFAHVLRTRELSAAEWNRKLERATALVENDLYADGAFTSIPADWRIPAGREVTPETERQLRAWVSLEVGRQFRRFERLELERLERARLERPDWAALQVAIRVLPAAEGPGESPDHHPISRGSTDESPGMSSLDAVPDLSDALHQVFNAMGPPPWFTGSGQRRNQPSLPSAGL